MIAERLDRSRGKPLAIPLRLQIAELLTAGQSRRAVAKSLHVSRRTVDKYAAVKISAQV